MEVAPLSLPLSSVTFGKRKMDRKTRRRRRTRTIETLF
jgi:hypothetical protein